MATEVVCRNPIPRPRAANNIKLFELDQGMSIYIVDGANAEVVFELITGGRIAC
jgi:hypothetical protein